MKMDVLNAEATDQLHQRAIDAATQYRRWESKLLEVLDQIDRGRLYLNYGASSLYAYCTQQLKLSESVSYNLITVTRKSREVPELLEKTRQGAITLSNARRVSSVLTTANQAEWLTRASQLSARALEKEIARVIPESGTPERVAYVTHSRVKLELGLSEEQMLRLRRAQDLVSQSKGESASLEETLAAMTELFLARRCPIEKARRMTAKKGSGETPRTTSDEDRQHCAANPRKPLDENPQRSRAEDSRKLLTEIQKAPDGDDRVTLGSVLPSASAHQEEFNPPARAGENRYKATSPGPSIPPKSSGQTKRGAPSPLSQQEHYLLVFPNRSRRPISKRIQHQVYLRDGGRCTYRTATGGICGEMRFIEIHHVKPVAHGGSNALENLRTLCAAHHRYLHRS